MFTDFRPRSTGRLTRQAARFLCVLLSLSLTGCAPAGTTERTCNVIFEDNEELFFYRQVYPVTRGSDLTVSIGVPTGCRITSVNYDRWSVSGKTGWSESFDYYTLILHEVHYPVVIRLTAGPAYTTTYHFGSGDSLTVQEESPRLSPNTLPYEARFEKEGYLPIGWNTAPDGSGVHVGFGSQPVWEGGTKLELYTEYLPCTRLEDLTWEQAGGEITITGYHGSGDLVIPAQLDGLPVTAIAAGAFGDITADTAAFPPTLKTMEEGAFRSLTVEELYLFDDLETVSDASFGALSVAHLHINAVRPPVYCGSYFDTLSEKAAYLRSLEGQKKLVLFCGSSARFGYDSPMLETAFSDYKVVNMGVYAYANMLPQAMLVLRSLEPGDIVLSSPELDAIGTQFCGSAALDKETFAMMESNYDMLAGLDCREFTHIFDAFAQYQEARDWLSPVSYNDVPSQYDEDGNRMQETTYNRYGDYILYRENNTGGKTFGIKRAFYNADHITAQDWDGLNRVYDAFAARGARVFFTWSPRSRVSISEDSTEQSIAELDRLIRGTLHAQVISPIRDSLLDPLYFYGTDNHLSTEGVELRTRQVIEDLRRALEGME